MSLLSPPMPTTSLFSPQGPDISSICTMMASINFEGQSGQGHKKFRMTKSVNIREYILGPRGRKVRTLTVFSVTLSFLMPA